MAHPTKVQFFDDVAFMEDVNTYLENFEIPKTAMAASIGIVYQTVIQIGKPRAKSEGHIRPSLDVACALAWYCDLDLNKYIIGLGDTT